MIDIDRDAAHDAAQRELGKPIYPRDSLTQQILEWLDKLLYRIMVEASSVPGGWFTVAVLVVLLGVAVVVAVRVARRTMRTNRGADRALFGTDELGASQHRALAEQLAGQGNWSAAIRHRLRAVARHLEETGVLAAVPGRTATELAHDAGEVFPVLSDEFRRSAETFNDVTYGEQPGTEEGYRVIADLDDQLRTRPRPGGELAAIGPQAEWAPLR